MGRFYFLDQPRIFLTYFSIVTLSIACSSEVKNQRNSAKSEDQQVADPQDPSINKSIDQNQSPGSGTSTPTEPSSSATTVPSETPPSANASKREQANLSAPGLGQCHWIGGPMGTNSSLKWGYSSSTTWDLSLGDSWSAIEPTPGQFNWKQIDQEVSYVKSKGQKMWFQIQTGDYTNKEHNIPKWAIDAGMETIHTRCGTEYFKVKRSSVDFSQAQLLEQAEAVEDGEYYKLPVKIHAVFDPLYREKLASALNAAGKKYDGMMEITAVNFMGGGNYGEMTLGAKCANWETNCTPDVVNTACPVVQSLARILKRDDPTYKDKNLEDIANSIAVRSDCKKNPCLGGNCPSLYGAPCYVVEDYWLEGLKDLADKYTKAFPSTPIVVQWGAGISGTGAYTKEFALWLNEKYGSRYWFKFNGWGPSDPYFYKGIFNDLFANSTRHGYEPGTPYRFSRVFWESDSNANNWCNSQNPKPDECSDLTTATQRLQVGKKAIVAAIAGGLVQDHSSYLCMQSDFFDTSTLSNRGDGRMSNDFHFNPNDNTPNCDNSEINVSTYGVGFCPGFLNKTFDEISGDRAPPTFQAN